MEFDVANQLRKDWSNKPCTHYKVEKEYYLRSATGDYVCITCGRTFYQRPSFTPDTPSNNYSNPNYDKVLSL